MLKAIFMDYYGTAVHEMGPGAAQVVKRICASAKAGDPREAAMYWKKIFEKRSLKACGDSFRPQHEVALETFREAAEYFDSSEQPEELLGIMEEHWRTTKAYEDVKSFMERVGLPVYFVTNSDDDYVYANVKHNGLSPAGIVTSEQARYPKPRTEIFLYALKRAGISPDQAVHIGDSLSGDVYCPKALGIRPIWLNRENRQAPEGVESAGNLYEVLEILGIQPI